MAREALDIVAAHSLALSFYPEWISRLQEGLGELPTRLVAMNVGEAIHVLREGNCDLMLAYHWGKSEIAMIGRNRLRFDGGNKGALQIDWTYPINDRFSWYIQYFYGYGESLIDYDVKTARIGAGFSVNNMF